MPPGVGGLVGGGTTMKQFLKSAATILLMGVCLEGLALAAYLASQPEDLAVLAAPVVILGTISLSGYLVYLIWWRKSKPKDDRTNESNGASRPHGWN